MEKIRRIPQEFHTRVDGVGRGRTPVRSERKGNRKESADFHRGNTEITDLTERSRPCRPYRLGTRHEISEHPSPSLPFVSRVRRPRHTVSRSAPSLTLPITPGTYSRSLRSTVEIPYHQGPVVDLVSKRNGNLDSMRLGVHV